MNKGKDFSITVFSLIATESSQLPSKRHKSQNVGSATPGKPAPTSKKAHTQENPQPSTSRADTEDLTSEKIVAPSPTGEIGHKT